MLAKDAMSLLFGRKSFQSFGEKSPWLIGKFHNSFYSQKVYSITRKGDFYTKHDGPIPYSSSYRPGKILLSLLFGKKRETFTQAYMIYV